ncbi:MAG: type II toxin-antitoxin system VapC family toxin [Chloroflexi bacterium]|nr:type II toxin-antitoxin system VapC family toxin [Chloroflexota bacterium]MCY3581865.1 type II toxin-antitoxin system VapC family toxin [Chloroflexota bacterium]MCY3716511.1 type II toxin-antitoxin system VapC family toxin [Chloroflexota bacterium]MDE2651605.1 type II toxin-antitoxin system VapC family toxin [Chloroflexota bacterium]MXX50896.1 type II toxin-antitoxin system VapC family toxin [Chloroflexota bacterium]
MIYLLDTDICIHLLSGREPQVKRNADLAPTSAIAISALTMAEMFSGAARAEQPLLTYAKQAVFFMRYTILPFDEAAARVYGRIDGYLKDAGMRIGPVETQIAAIALARNLILVTRNTRHFRRVPNLAFEDWTVG